MHEVKDGEMEMLGSILSLLNHKAASSTMDCIYSSPGFRPLTEAIDSLLWRPRDGYW